jgi:hypothetical protein
MFVRIFSKKNKFAIFVFGFLVYCFVFLFPAMAGPLNSDMTTSMGAQQFNFLQKSGFDANTNAQTIIQLVIQAFLSLLSIIFIVLILYAGYSWMTAGGEEKKVEDAKGTITRAVIGLVIIIAAFAITYFVFNALPFNGDGGGAVMTGN